MWIKIVSSDQTVFDINTSEWHVMTATELPRLLDGSSTLLQQGVVRSTDKVLQFNVTADVLRPVVDALQRIHMASMIRHDRRVLALPSRPIVPMTVSESFWMLCELLLLLPYFSHACVRCKPDQADVKVQTTLCPVTVFHK